jgi:hypothetical protein
MPASRFARQIDELSEQERGIAEGALLAATATFADFADAKDSFYYCADGLTPEETWHAVTVEVARVTAIAAIEADGGGLLSAVDFNAIHNAIFEPVFGEATLKQRVYREDVTYGIVSGSFPDDLQPRRQHGMNANSLPRRLREISADLRAAIVESDAGDERGESHRVLEATLPAARAYARFLSAHPYWDGMAGRRFQS